MESRERRIRREVPSEAYETLQSGWTLEERGIVAFDPVQPCSSAFLLKLVADPKRKLVELCCFIVGSDVSKVLI